LSNRGGPDTWRVEMEAEGLIISFRYDISFWQPKSDSNADHMRPPLHCTTLCVSHPKKTPAGLLLVHVSSAAKPGTTKDSSFLSG